MGLAIDESLLADVNDPSLDVLNYAISTHKKAIRRLKKLFDYYDGKQAILKHTMANNQHSSNNRTVVNHAKYITDMATGFTVGNPIAYASKKGLIQPIIDALKAIDIQSHDTELEKDLSVFGAGDELIYLKNIGTDQAPDTQIRIEKIDPRAIVMVTDDTVEHNPLFAIYVQKKRNLQGYENGCLITVYTRQNVIQYRTSMGNELDNNANKTVEKHYFGDVPVVEYRNNEERQGDFEQVIPSIDDYNTLQSDRITDKQDFIDALLVVYGFTLDSDKDTGSSIKNGMINGAPGKGEDGASVEWLTKNFDETQIEILSKSVENDIHKISYIPNMNDENFMGNVSGEAMKYKLFAMGNLLSIKSSYMAKGLRKRLSLMQHVLTIKGQKVDISDCQITFTPNIPVNLTDIVANIKNADGVIPRTITYSWLPGTDNPQEVIDQMKQQTVDNIKTNQAALTGDTGTNIDQPPYNTDKSSNSEDKADDSNQNTKK